MENNKEIIDSENLEKSVISKEEEIGKKINEKIRKINTDKLITGLLAIALVLMIFNQFQLISINSDKNMATGMVAVEASNIIPRGVPEIYGQELGISYDDINPNDPSTADKTIGIMADIDRNTELEGDNLERYIRVTSQISCEYCCGAKSIIFSKEDAEERQKLIEEAIAKGDITEEDAENYDVKAGASACGCAHSFAMRGLSKYLIMKHGDEFTDDEILSELAKWKVLFFPGQMTAKAAIMEEKGIEFSYSSLGSNKYRDIEKGTSSSGGMVGGC